MREVATGRETRAGTHLVCTKVDSGRETYAGCGRCARMSTLVGKRVRDAGGVHGCRLWSRNVPGRRPDGSRKSTPVEKRAREGAGGARKSTPVEKRTREAAGGARKSTLVEKRTREAAGRIAEVDSGRETYAGGGRRCAEVDSGRETYAGRRLDGCAEVDSGRETYPGGGRRIAEVGSGRETHAATSRATKVVVRGVPGRPSGPAHTGIIDWTLLPRGECLGGAQRVHSTLPARGHCGSARRSGQVVLIKPCPSAAAAACRPRPAQVRRCRNRGP